MGGYNFVFVAMSCLPTFIGNECFVLIQSHYFAIYRLISCFGISARYLEYSSGDSTPACCRLKVKIWLSIFILKFRISMHDVIQGKFPIQSFSVLLHQSKYLWIVDVWIQTALLVKCQVLLCVVGHLLPISWWNASVSCWISGLTQVPSLL